MDSFIIEGGHALRGEIVPQGAKNEALEVICATLLTSEEVEIGNIPDIDKVEPMTYPFMLDNVSLREDKVVDELEIDEILVNSGSNLYNQVKLPKVVE